MNSTKNKISKTFSKTCTTNKQPKSQNNEELFVGRKSELDTLKNTYDRICQGRREMSLVMGQAGIGKTSLVMELRKTIERRNGIFIRGKYKPVQPKRSI